MDEGPRDTVANTSLTHDSKLSLLHMASLDITAKGEDPTGMKRLNGIICTIGPSTESVEVLMQLCNKGMNIARLNFSHGSYEQHSKLIANVREAAQKTNRLVGLALDTKGPEIRTGKLREGLGREITYEAGQRVKISVNKQHYSQCDQSLMYVDYVNLPRVVSAGCKVFVDDGLLQIEVNEVGSDFVMGTCINTAPIGDNKGVNLPDSKVDLPAISEKDKSDLRFAREQKLDMIFASFIRKPSDVEDVRDALGPGEKIMIISKIENQEGCDNFMDILQVTDGVMVARGDLGIEIPPEKVFVAQKMMIANCNKEGKPVICATQMLESMTKNPRPTRAEVSDVANAIIDGADCVMLSGETAKGKYPLNAVETMARCCRQAQIAAPPKARFDEIRRTQPHPLPPREVVAQSAVNTAYEVGAAAIIVLSNTGTSVRLIAKYRPHCPILAVTSKPTTARQLLLSRGVFPVLTEEPTDRKDYDIRVQAGIRQGKADKDIAVGDPVVVVHSDGRRPELGANLVRVLFVS
jgi:pyruvate kinase